MMDEKRRLIDSMQKLIKHVSLSQKNQQQIFQSLSKKDIGKIVGNLQDISLQLRTVSFCLLSKLLYRDESIKERFCEMIGIPIIAGKVLLNPKILSSIPQNKLASFLKLIKKPISPPMNQLNSYSTWYINIKQQPYRIDYTDYSIGDIDPTQYAVGIILKKISQNPPDYFNSLPNQNISQICISDSNDNKTNYMANSHRSTLQGSTNLNRSTQLNASTPINKNQELKLKYNLTNNNNGRVKLLNASLNYNQKSNDYNNKLHNVPIYGFDDKKYTYNKVSTTNKPQSALIGVSQYHSPHFNQTGRQGHTNSSYTITSPIIKRMQYINGNRNIGQSQSVQKKYSQTGYQFYKK